MPGRVEIDNVQPVVSCGAYPAKAAVGEVVPVSAAVWREGHEAVAATLVVRYLGPGYPQVTETRRVKAVQAPEKPVTERDGRVDQQRVKPLSLPMTMGLEPYVFHGQFTPDRVGLWLSASTGGATRFTPGGMGWSPNWTPVRARKNCPTIYPVDRAVRACRYRRATRPARAAVGGRRSTPHAWGPGHPNRAGVGAADRRNPGGLSAPRFRHPGRAVQHLGGPAAGPVRLLVRDVSPLDRRTGRRRQPGARHIRYGNRRASADRGNGIRRRLPAADPPDRQGAPKVPRQLPTAAPQCGVSVGDRQQDEGGHDAVHPDLGTIDDFDDFVAATRELGMEVALDLALQSHPIILGRATPQWFTELPTAPSPTRRTRRRSTRTSIRSTSIRRPRGPLTTKCCGWSGIGSATASSSFASTTRTPSPRLLGLVDRRGQRLRPRRTLPLRGLHAAGPPVRAGQTRLHAVVQLLHVADGEVGADRIPATTSPPSPTSADPTSFVNAPDILHAILQHNGPGMFAIRAVLAATMGPAWCVYSGYELFEHRACGKAARST